MFKKSILALTTFASILSMTSCAATRWTKPGADQYQEYRDETACKYEADKYAGYSGNGNVDLWNHVKLQSECMEQKGYCQGCAPTPVSPTGGQVGQGAAVLWKQHQVYSGPIGPTQSGAPMDSELLEDRK